MTATDTLRAMLDERGVEYETFSGAFATKTCWPCANGLTAIFVEYDDGTTRFEMSRWHVAPEQTIAATLEAETCFPALNSERDGIPYLDPWWVCSECGCQLTESRLGRIWQNYCPNCGRRIRIRRVGSE